jgi:hypothetical protein
MLMQGGSEIFHPDVLLEHSILVMERARNKLKKVR